MSLPSPRTDLPDQASTSRVPLRVSRARSCTRRSGSAFHKFVTELFLPSMSVFTNPAGGAIEHAHAYVAAILELLGDKDPIAVLRATAPALGRVVDTTPHHVLVRPEAPGKWSMGEVLAHLADSDLVW